MSYLAGLTVGALLARQIRRPAGEGEGVKLIHGIAHRRRYYHPGIKAGGGYAEGLENYLRSRPEIKSAVINGVTGSVLINYSCSEEKMDRIIGCCPAPVRAGGLVEAGLKKRMKGLFKALDAGVYGKTGGQLDLPSSLAVLFSSWGIYNTLKLKQWPNGPQMLWWSYNLLRK